MGTVPNSIGRTAIQKISERWSVQDFGAVGDGVTDDSAAINLAIAEAADIGGREIYLPGGKTYALEAPIYFPSTAAGITLVGDGVATRLLRVDNMPAGEGVIDIEGSGITLRNLVIDGDVTTSVGLQYGVPGDFANDPQNAALTGNTSVWIHPGASRIRLDHVKITHTGGYAINIDARDGDVEDVDVYRCVFENCRPHRFGTDGGDLNYGAWTGGILAQGDCRASESKLFAVRGLRVINSQFHRMMGNCIWMHSYGFDVQHKDVVVANNLFTYIARDAYLSGNLNGGACVGNVARFVGFRHTTDIDTPVGAYLANHYAVAFDASGYVRNHSYVGNIVDEVYGGAFDLDGLRDSVIANNIATTTQAIAKGIQTGDTSGNNPDDNITIRGNFLDGFNAGAIVLNQAQGVVCEANTIRHPASAAAQPILLYSTDEETLDNIVRGNDIYWPDNGWCIVESDGGTGTGFSSSTRNIVYDNRYRGGAKGEFLKDANSASTTGMVMSTNSASATTRQETTLAREGTGSSAAWKIYDKRDTTETQYLQLQFDNGLLNISENGGAQTGIITTAARTSLGFKDAVWTGKLMTDGFIAAYNYAGGATSYQAADANALTDDWALLRYNKTGGKWEQSVTTSTGTRVWTDLVSGTLSGLTSGRVPYTTGAAALADSANLTWNNASRVLTVTGATGTAGIVAATSYIQSAEGFLTTSSATDAIQASTGGVTARFLIGTRSFTLTAETEANAGVSGAGQGRIYFDSSSNKFRVSQNGAAYVDLIGGGSIAGLTSGRVPYATGATSLGDSANFTWNNGSRVLTVTGATGTAGIVAATSYIQSAEGFLTTSSATDAIQASTGGVTARFLIGTRSLSMTGESAANAGLSGSGQGRIYFDSSSNKFRVSQNGGAYVDMLASGPAGSSGQVQFNSSGSFGADADLHWDNSLKRLGIGTASPEGPIHVSGQFASIYFDGYSSVAPNFVFRHANGTAGSPTATLSGDRIGQFAVQGYGTSRVTTSGVAFNAEANFSGSSMPTNMVFSTTASGSTTRTERMRITGAGNVLIGTGTDDASGAKLQISGFVSATTGLYTVSSATNALQVPNGGITAKFLIGTTSLTLTTDASAAVSAAGQIRIRGNGTKAQISENGGGYVDLVGGGGVASLNSLTGALSIAGTSNQITVTPSGSTITLSTPQNIHTSAAVQFYSVLTSDAIQSNRGTGPAIYAPNAYMQAAGFVSTGLTAYNSIQSTAGISAGNGTSGGFYVAATQVINTSGQFVGAGVDVGSNGINAGGYNVNGGYTGQTWNVVGSFTIGGTPYTTLIFRGGVLVSAS